METSLAKWLVLDVDMTKIHYCMQKKKMTFYITTGLKDDLW